MDLDLLVIGSGPGGQRAAVQGAKLGKRVAVVDPKEQSMHDVVGIMTGAVVHDIEHQATERNGGGAADPKETPAT